MQNGQLNYCIGCTIVGVIAGVGGKQCNIIGIAKGSVNLERLVHFEGSSTISGIQTS